MPTHDNRSPWAMLQAGNARYVEGRSNAQVRRSPERRSELVGSQAPSAIVLGCADSRVPVEILFDQGLGDLFVVRTAGHVVDSAVLGSIEYAVQILAVPSIVIVGHDGCGAVAAAIAMVDQGMVPPGSIREVAERIAPDVVRARLAGAGTFEETVEQHACHTAELLSERSALIADAVRAGRLTVTPTRYSLSSGRVTEAVPLRQLLPV
ncbi:carbonic anhydrase [Actinoplanes philippinensis]|uniref:Carbonic anhydrase n=1 Tax=Actinoplanes philippinensis TaxID=35752 RepID=A0A1I1ZF66_9ACTN|nr:carbonic anhydrase [Actinoplanes philippinensis]GIE75522.1 carbonic anhydrase [Actinoplanes philippinensis]SFE30222.1 carbonic anhydrase [Actinoplanes philippinensis]